MADETPKATAYHASPLVDDHRTHDANGIRVGAWSADICGCCTDIVPNCCMATCLPFISVAQIAHRMNVARYSVVLISFLVLYVASIALSCISFATAVKSKDDSTIFSSWSDDSSSVRISIGDSSTPFDLVVDAILSVVALIYLVLIWQLRSKVRVRFQIPGSCCGDYCCVWWCSCCTIAQMATHVQSYQPGSCDFGPPDMLPAYD